jgi:hypothetical protein
LIVLDQIEIARGQVQASGRFDLGQAEAVARMPYLASDRRPHRHLGPHHQFTKIYNTSVFINKILQNVH